MEKSLNLLLSFLFIFSCAEPQMNKIEKIELAKMKWKVMENQTKHDFLYWEFPEYDGQIAIRMGDFKVVRQHLKNPEKATIELYNLVNDPKELKNIAEAHPELLEKAADIFKNEHTKAEADRFVIPLLETGLLSKK